MVMIQKTKLSASLEDYLEAILLISQRQGEVRSRDIKEQLGVSGPSVTEALRNLDGKGLVNYAPYEPITLTSEGTSVARSVLFRHETLRDFFIEVLGIDAGLADEGACKMEHVASSNIIERMIKYRHYLKQKCTKRGCGRIRCFEEYLKENETGLGLKRKRSLP